MHVVNFTKPLRTLCKNNVSCHFHKPFIFNQLFIHAIQCDISGTGFFLYICGFYSWTESEDYRAHFFSFLLFWRISTNDPLNEPFTVLIMVKLGEKYRGRMDGRNVKCQGVQRTETKRPLWGFQTHSCQIHKRCAIFRLMAINTRDF